MDEGSQEIKGTENIGGAIARSTTRAARARFAHKIDRQWQKGARAPMPQHWRLVCDIALAMKPREARDEHFRSAVVASLRFATPDMRGQWDSIDVWARDPRNVALLAVQLWQVLRTHARGAK